MERGLGPILTEHPGLYFHTAAKREADREIAAQAALTTADRNRQATLRTPVSLKGDRCLTANSYSGAGGAGGAGGTGAGGAGYGGGRSSLFGLSWHNLWLGLQLYLGQISVTEVDANDCTNPEILKVSEACMRACVHACTCMPASVGSLG